MLEGYISQDDLQHPSGGVISVLSVNYHPSARICIPSGGNNFLPVASSPPLGMRNANIFFQNSIITDFFSVKNF